MTSLTHRAFFHNEREREGREIAEKKGQRGEGGEGEV